MPPIINFKICDNSADCNGITKCPFGVFGWDDKKKTITVDIGRCADCGACADFCTVNAIRYAKDQEEYEKIKREIDEDTRTVADLFVDRYGATPLDDKYLFELSPEKVKNRIESNRPVIVEFNDYDTVECLLKSIPIVEISREFHPDATYSRFFVKPQDFKTYGVAKTPCLKFYHHGKLLGELPYFHKGDQDEYMEKIRRFGAKIPKKT